MSQPMLGGAKVLILEDDYWQADDCRQRLTAAGATVVAMTGGIATALVALDSAEVDVGLLDINLGGIQSFEVARALVKRGVPVLFLTGYEKEFLPSDLVGVPLITKPAEWDEVLEQLSSLLR